MRVLPFLIVVTGCSADPGAAIDAAVAGDDAPASVDAAPAAEPTWQLEMTSADAADVYTRMQSGAAVELGVDDARAGDGKVARLRFPGIPSLGAADRVGPSFASELGTDRADFQYGVYRVRVALASCAPGEEVVNGLFTYFNDGNDHDSDGMIDNAEIDLEILCGTPDVLFLSVWTEYGPADAFRKWTRAIDLSTGDLWDAPSDHEYGLVRAGRDASLALPTLLDPGAFVELGVEWRADRVRFFATIDGAERTLAELTDAARIPSLPGALLFNVWHPSEHWFGGGAAPDYPASDATLLVDSARYWR